MAPEAPVRFSTTTLRPRISPSFCAISRPTASVPAPGAKGTTILIAGWAPPWARAEAGSSAAELASAIQWRRLSLVFRETGESEASLGSMG